MSTTSRPPARRSDAARRRRRSIARIRSWGRAARGPRSRWLDGRAVVPERPRRWLPRCMRRRTADAHPSTEAWRAKIAIFAPSMAGGGAERGAVKLAEGLVRRGFDVDLVLAAAEGPRLEEIPAEVRLVDLGAGRVAGSLPGLVRYLRREKPQRSEEQT